MACDGAAGRSVTAGAGRGPERRSAGLAGCSEAGSLVHGARNGDPAIAPDRAPRNGNGRLPGLAAAAPGSRVSNHGGWRTGGMRGLIRCAVLMAALLAGGCTQAAFKPPERNGPLALVESAAGRQLWLATVQEETRLRHV